jgi:glycosyltransferase involved in cell wall biosynthesis
LSASPQTLPAAAPPAPAVAPRPAVFTLSAVVPMHDEAANAATFLPALAATLAALAKDWEIVVVDDGSRDATRALVLEAGEQCRVRYVGLSRNFGKEAALSAGLATARGDVVICLDGDFQHPLEAVPAMVARWREGDDMVYGVRDSREGEGIARRLGARLFYALVRMGSPVPIPEGAGDFRLLDRRVVDALVRLPERSRFMKGLYGWVGFRSASIPYRVQPRAGGRSSFSLGRLLALAMTGITSFSFLPLRAIGLLGLLVSLGAIGYGGWVVFETLFIGVSVPGYPTIVVSVTFLSGIQLLSLGVIGEYLGRVYEEVKQRPAFLVAEEIDLGALPARPAARGGR